MADNIHLITQALPLPKGFVRQVKPSLVHANQVYAYNLLIDVPRVGNLALDARQLPVDVTQLQGQYGEISLYATQINQPRPALATSSASDRAQYLGQQLSLVFFPDLLVRYKSLLTAADESLDTNDTGEDEIDDGIPQFQDDYANTLEAYTPQGFCLGDYESAPVLRFSWGTVLLTPSVQEQIEAIAQAGQWVEVTVSEWSLACFKTLAYPN